MVTSVPSKVRKCAEPQDHLRSEMSFLRTCNIPNLILHSPFNASLVLCLHGCAIAYALKQTFALFAIGTLPAAAGYFFFLVKN